MSPPRPPLPLALPPLSPPPPPTPFPSPLFTPARVVPSFLPLVSRQNDASFFFGAKKNKVNDGTVEKLFLEDGTGYTDISSGDSVLAAC